MFYVVNFVMKVVLIGVFVLIGVIVLKFGLDLFFLLGKFVILVYLVLIFFLFVVLGGIVKWVGINIFYLFCYMKDELLLVYSIFSFEIVFLCIMEKFEKMGCLKVIVLFVVLIGYIFNLDGFVFY